jgi:predicted ribosome quality control (RQC) complex YloA/Tae2 family protein
LREKEKGIICFTMGEKEKGIICFTLREKEYFALDNGFNSKEARSPCHTPHPSLITLSLFQSTLSPSHSSLSSKHLEETHRSIHLISAMETNPLFARMGRKQKIPTLTLEQLQQEIRSMWENVTVCLQVVEKSIETSGNDIERKMELNRDKWDQVILGLQNIELKLELLSKSEKEDVDEVESKMGDPSKKLNTDLWNICSQVQQLSIGKDIDSAILRQLQGDLPILKT